MSPLLPKAFLERTKKLLPASEFAAFQAACLRPLRKSIRVNTLKISVADFQKRAEQKGWRLTPIPWCAEGFWIDRSQREQKEIPLGKTAEHMMGLFYVQEASSMLPPEALFHAQQELVETRHGAFLLDMAAAPGSKTTQLAAMTKGNGCIVANEFSASRIKKLYANLERCGVSNAVLTHYDGQKFASMTPEFFDFILLDAPCTGEGTIRKDPKALDTWSERNIQIAAGVQKKLITAAFQALKPGGVLVYSTCTLATEENEEICHFLQEQGVATPCSHQVIFESLHDLFPGAERVVTPEGFLRIWPQSFDTEGFFVARIRKKRVSDTQEGIHDEKVSNFQYPISKRKNFPFAPIQKAVFQELEKYYENHFGFPFSFPSERLWQRDREIWLFPEGVEVMLPKLYCDRIGIKLCEIHSRNIKTLHEMTVCFGADFEKQTLELSSANAEQYYAGRDISFDTSELSYCQEGEVLLRFDGFPLGIGKLKGNTVKNQLPREVVRTEIAFAKTVDS